MSAQQVLFYLFAAFAVVSALGMVLNVRNTVAAALSLVVTMVALAGIYVLLEAHLVAAIQVMVYGGAIVVLFLFVVMLLNLRSDAFAPGRARLQKLAGALLGIALLAQIVRSSVALPAISGNTEQVGWALYTDYLVPFELASMLLLAAMVGAILFARKAE